MAESKVCSACKQDLPLDMFHAQQHGMFGRRGICKKCRSRSAAERNKGMATRTAVNVPTEKVCVACTRLLPASEFYPCKYQKHGLRSLCKKCTNKDSVARVRGDKTVLAKNRQWRMRNAEKYATIRKASEQKHKAKHRFERNQRSSRRYHSITFKHRIRESDWKALVFLFGGRCLLCGEDKKLTVDHIIPVTRYGYHEISNIQPLCLSCNSSKHTTVLDARPFEIGSVDELHRMATERGLNAESHGWSR